MPHIAVALLVAGALYIALWNSFFVGFFNDDVMYIALAQSLAQGTGYTDIELVGQPPHGKYPPGFPLMLAPLRALWPHDFMPLKLLGVLFALGTVWLTARLYEEEPPSIRWGATALVAMNPFLARFASTVLSDVPFLCLTTGYLVLARRLSFDSLRGPAGLAVLAALGFYLRAPGMVLFVATLVYFAVRRIGWKPALTYAAIFTGLVLPYFWRRGHAGYQGDIVLRYEDMPLADLVVQNLSYYAAAIPLTLLSDPARHVESLLRQSLSLPLTLLCIATWVCIILGFIVCARRRIALRAIVTCGFIGLFLPWPFLDARFFLPIFPLLIGYLLEGVHAVSGRSAERATGGVAAAICAALLVCNVATIKYPVAAESRPTNATHSWLRDHTDVGEAITAKGGAFWLYTGRLMAVLPHWPGAPEGAIRNLLRQDTRWVLLRDAGYPDEAPEWIAALEGRKSLFERVYQNPQEGTRIYRVSGDRARFNAAYDCFVRGVQTLSAGDWKAGKAALDECLRLEPDFPPAELNRAIACNQLNEKDEARRTLQALLARHPDHARARALLETL